MELLQKWVPALPVPHLLGLVCLICMVADLLPWPWARHLVTHRKRILWVTILLGVLAGHNDERRSARMFGFMTPLYNQSAPKATPRW